MFDAVTRQDILQLALIFGCSMLVSSGLVALTRVLALRLRFTDRPNANTGNAGGAAMGGGVGIVISALLMFWLFPGHIGTQTRIVAMIAGLCALGLLDDMFRLTPLVKVLGQAACAALYVMAEPASFGAAVFMMLFLILTSNAWNVVDVMDSLLASIGAVAMLGVGVVMLIHGFEPQGLPIIPIIASGAIGGFLVWNRPPAKIIMGDAGSLPMGMLFGVLVLESFSHSVLLAIAVILPGIIPFLEVGFLIIERSRRGIPFYRSTPDHFALRMLHNGYTVAQVLKPVIWAGIGLAVLACILELTSFHVVIAIAAVVLLVAAVVRAYRFLIRLRVGGSVR